MRIVSQDGTRSFPYDQITLFLRIRYFEDNIKYVITAIFNGTEYDMGYYTDEKFAKDVFSDILETPNEIYEYDEFDEDEDADLMFISEPSQILYVKIPEDKLTDIE